ncbi:hypothetical protein [uncultured Phascolarctobacterium sp.]|uniref:hypothetical protein n=1 Tax=uncultured Phascolarctobacterium sp. TaxID=512296 RepID=UPI0025E13BFC|nr:hypothetical protein [uncultured Phascolarctobacterium sp.]
MADIVESLAGNKMLLLKQDIAFLRQRLAECTDETAKQAIRRELMEKETYYNILADRQRINF